jgi:hypothetical protein
MMPEKFHRTPRHALDVSSAAGVKIRLAHQRDATTMPNPEAADIQPKNRTLTIMLQLHTNAYLWV